MGRRGLVIQPYVPPDYATLAQAAKQEVSRKLGRQINDWELSILTGEMGGDYREAYDNNVEMERAIWEAEGRAEAGIGFDGPEVVVGSTGATQVDPQARLQQRFDARFEDEMDERERSEQSAAATSNLFGGLSRLSGMVGR
jgi:hypothetical protein